MLTDGQKVDARRHCGYPAYGATPAGNIGWRFFQAYGLLEYRLNNLGEAEVAVLLNYLATLNGLETAVPPASGNLDTVSAAAWRHNQNETDDRIRLLDSWRTRLCAFLGVPPGPGLAVGLSWVV